MHAAERGWPALACGSSGLARNEASSHDDAELTPSFARRRDSAALLTLQRSVPPAAEVAAGSMISLLVGRLATGSSAPASEATFIGVQLSFRFNR